MFRARLLQTFAVIVCSQLGFAQAIETEQEAREAAGAYASKLGISLPRDQMEVRTEGRFALAVSGRWSVLSVSRTAAFGLSPASGRLLSFSHRAADNRRHERKPGEQERAIKTEEQAWALAESYLRIARLDDLGFVRNKLETPADQPGAAFDRNNRADMYGCGFVQKPKGYEHVDGFVNSAAVTIDVVAGCVLCGSASESWTFDPPESIITIDQALEAFRSHFVAERAAQMAKVGGKDYHWYDWPGDSLVRSKLHQVIFSGGERTFTSDYGEQFTNDRRARLCWSFGTERGIFIIDAENGLPMDFGIFANAISEKSPPLGKTKEPDGDTQAPVDTVARSQNQSDTPVVAVNGNGSIVTWAALGSVAAVGFGLILWKFFSHR